MYYNIWTIGCQMNKADSESMASALEELGFRHTEDLAQANVIVANSCAVRQSAEQRVIGKLGSLKRLRGQRDDLTIVLAGCMVGDDVTDLRRKLPQVDVFIRPSDVDGLVKAVSARWQDRMEGVSVGHCQAVSEPSRPATILGGEENVIGGHGETVTAWVPIIYGCNNFCSYCIVPYRRGRERSRPVDEIVANVASLVSQGIREVTLLGQNVDSYGRDLPGKPDLASLLSELDGIDGLYRIRFLTSHPKDLTERLMQAVAQLPKVCEHINLPVQHGDDDILRAMRRGYTVRQYRDLVDRLRSYVPEVRLSTDVIVGYPGESIEQFNHTYDLLADIRFDVVHAAMYSPRPGTRAASLADDVPPEQKKERLNLVEQLQERVASEVNRGLVGKTVEVLVEGLHKGKWQGRTRGNTLVFFPGDGNLRGQLIDVEIVKGTAWSLQGKPCTLASAKIGRREGGE